MYTMKTSKLSDISEHTNEEKQDQLFLPRITSIETAADLDEMRREEIKEEP